ncbi:Mitochondrial import protein 1 [Wickerhamiella sorbophila]|uniref:Mitochondrial import protein 1 n=1 Tax=Wickerhamiella sorbophila TaxID=45607 RepID=A0A2T0FCQ2_9ASCO|nr:Mitochondrial import protein 1 [Wickerhamiella sorbophila]PRT52782.1 Mitochondrial import protein 1 [Wickerhamiella sorbophila]
MSSVYEWSETESQSEDESVVVERKIPVLSITRRILINLAIPFINGIMLGFGEIFAHEIGVAYGWRQSRTYDPTSPLYANRRRWLWFF